MSAARAVQTALRARLLATPAITALVPADAIFDRHTRPAAPACIILGEAEEEEDGGMLRDRTRVYHTIHVWKRELGLEGAAAIAAAIRAAVHADRLDLGPAYHAVGAWVPRVRTLRDPDGEFGHAVVSVAAIVEELAL
jgi:hypothetical protein